MYDAVCVTLVASDRAIHTLTLPVQALRMLRLPEAMEPLRITLASFDGPACGLHIDFQLLNDAGLAMPLSRCFDNLEQQVHMQFEELLAQLQPPHAILTAAATLDEPVAAGSQHTAASADVFKARAAAAATSTSQHFTQASSQGPAASNRDTNGAQDMTVAAVRDDDDDDFDDNFDEEEDATAAAAVAPVGTGQDTLGPDAYPSIVPATCLNVDMHGNILASGPEVMVPQLVVQQQQQQALQANMVRTGVVQPSVDQGHQQHQQLHLAGQTTVPLPLSHAAADLLNIRYQQAQWHSEECNDRLNRLSMSRGLLAAADAADVFPAEHLTMHKVQQDRQLQQEAEVESSDRHGQQQQWPLPLRAVATGPQQKVQQQQPLGPCDSNRQHVALQQQQQRHQRPLAVKGQQKYCSDVLQQLAAVQRMGARKPAAPAPTPSKGNQVTLVQSHAQQQHCQAGAPMHHQHRLLPGQQWPVPETLQQQQQQQQAVGPETFTAGYWTEVTAPPGSSKPVPPSYQQQHPRPLQGSTANNMERAAAAAAQHVARQAKPFRMPRPAGTPAPAAADPAAVQTATRLRAEPGGFKAPGRQAPQAAAAAAEVSTSHAGDDNRDMLLPAAVAAAGEITFIGAAGSRVEPPEVALAKACSFGCLGDEQQPNEVAILAEEQRVALHTAGLNIGFTTAGGSRVQVSAAAIAKARCLFADDEPDLRLAGAEAEAEAAAAAAEAPELGTKCPARSGVLPVCGLGAAANPVAAAFATAAGTRIKVSEAALAKAMALFADDDCAAGNHAAEAAHLGGAGPLLLGYQEQQQQQQQQAGMQAMDDDMQGTILGSADIAWAEAAEQEYAINRTNQAQAVPVTAAAAAAAGLSTMTADMPEQLHPITVPPVPGAPVHTYAPAPAAAAARSMPLGAADIPVNHDSLSDGEYEHALAVVDDPLDPAAAAPDAAAAATNGDSDPHPPAHAAAVAAVDVGIYDTNAAAAAEALPALGAVERTAIVRAAPDSLVSLEGLSCFQGYIVEAAAVGDSIAQEAAAAAAPAAATHGIDTAAAAGDGVADAREACAVEHNDATTADTGKATVAASGSTQDTRPTDAWFAACNAFRQGIADPCSSTATATEPSLPVNSGDVWSCEAAVSVGPEQQGVIAPAAAGDLVAAAAAAGDLAAAAGDLTAVAARGSDEAASLQHSHDGKKAAACTVGSAVQAVGPAVQAVGPAVQAVGPAVQAVGPAVQAVGPAVQAVGPPVQAVGPPVQAVGPAASQLSGEAPALAAVAVIAAMRLGLPHTAPTGTLGGPGCAWKAQPKAADDERAGADARQHHQCNPEHTAQQQQQQQQDEHTRQPCAAPVSAAGPPAAAAAAERAQQTLRGKQLLSTALASSAVSHVPCPLAGCIWASGDGVMLQQQSVQHGSDFIARLRLLGILPPAAAAAGGGGGGGGAGSSMYAGCNCLHQPVLAELVVGGHGQVQLLLAVRQGGQRTAAACLSPAGDLGMQQQLMQNCKPEAFSVSGRDIVIAAAAAAAVRADLPSAVEVDVPGSEVVIAAAAAAAAAASTPDVVPATPACPVADTSTGLGTAAATGAVAGISADESARPPVVVAATPAMPVCVDPTIVIEASPSSTSEMLPGEQQQQRQEGQQLAEALLMDDEGTNVAAAAAAAVSHVTAAHSATPLLGPLHCEGAAAAAAGDHDAPGSTLPVLDLFGAAYVTPPVAAAAAGKDGEDDCSTIPVADLFAAAAADGDRLVDAPAAASEMLIAQGRQQPPAEAEAEAASMLSKPAAAPEAEAGTPEKECVDDTVGATVQVYEEDGCAAAAAAYKNHHADAVGPTLNACEALELDCAADAAVIVDAYADAVGPTLNACEEPPYAAAAAGALCESMHQGVAALPCCHKHQAEAPNLQQQEPCKQQGPQQQQQQQQALPGCDSLAGPSVGSSTGSELPQFCTADLQDMLDQAAAAAAAAMPAEQHAEAATAVGLTCAWDTIPAADVAVAGTAGDAAAAAGKPDASDTVPVCDMLAAAGEAVAAAAAAATSVKRKLAAALQDEPDHHTRPLKRHSLTPEDAAVTEPQQQRQLREAAAVARNCGHLAAGGDGVSGSTAAGGEAKQRLNLHDHAQQPEEQQQQQQQDEPATALPSSTAAASLQPAAATSAARPRTLSLIDRLEAREKEAAADGLCVAERRSCSPRSSSSPAAATAAAGGSSGVAGLSTAGGKAVTVSDAQRVAFQQRMGIGAASHNQLVPPAAPSAAAAAVGSGGGGSGGAFAGLPTAGRKTTLASDPKATACQQQVGIAAVGQQQTPPPPPPAAAAAAAAKGDSRGFTGLSTAGGKAVSVSDAERARFTSMMGLKEGAPQQQQQQQPEVVTAAAARPPHPAAGLSTAGGRQVSMPDAAQLAAFQQKMGIQTIPPQRTAAMAAAAAVLPSVAAGVPGTLTAAATEKTPATTAAAAAQDAKVAPSLASRKRPSNKQQQQLGQRKQQRKAFKAPAMTKPRVTRANTAAGATAAQPGCAYTQHQQQQQQQQQHQQHCADDTAVVKQQKTGVNKLSLTEYFALAKSQRQQATAVTAAAVQGSKQQLGATAAAAAADADTEWVVPSLPVTPEEAAAFTFAAAAAAAVQTSDKSPQQLQHHELQPQDIANNPTAAECVLLMPAAFTTAACQTVSKCTLTSSSSNAATFGTAEARQQLVAWGADSSKATPAWVANHYKWIVWKLASYDRKLMRDAADGSSSSSSSDGSRWHGRSGLVVAAAPGSSSTACCLSVRNVMQQLQHRYKAEMREGQRSVLKKILEQDLPASVPIVLMVSAIRGMKAKQQQQQQQQTRQGSRSTEQSPAAAAAVGEVTGIQLSDGWYAVNAQLDEPLKALIAQGTIQVGSKLRVVGAELHSDRPAEPLEAARSALLTLSYNRVSPAAWDAKLGPVATGHTLRLLTQVHPSGGLVPRLLLLVQRSYPLQYFMRGSEGRGGVYYTIKSWEALQNKAERQQGQIHQAAAAAARSAELRQCNAWARSKQASAVEKAYAAAVLGDNEDGAGLAGNQAVSSGELQRFKAERENALERLRQQHLQQLLAEAESAAAAAAGANGSSSAAAASAAVPLSLERPVPVKRFRVTGILPRRGTSPSHTDVCISNTPAVDTADNWPTRYGQAIIKVWRASEAVQQMDEGTVVIATGLTAGTDNRSSMVELAGLEGGRILELSTTKITTWTVLGMLQKMHGRPDLDCGPSWKPRCYLKPHQLCCSMVGVEFDAAGVLLWAGEVVRGSRGYEQWVFLAGGTSQQQQQQQQQCAEAAQQLPQQQAVVAAPAVLAVRLAGSSCSCIDWLEPSQQTRHPINGDGSAAISTAAATGQPQLQPPAAAALLNTGAAALANQTDARGGACTPEGRSVTRKLLARQKQQQLQQQQNQQQSREVIVCYSNLILTSFDRTNQMWVAAGPDTAEVHVVAPRVKAGDNKAAAAVQELRAWAVEQPQLLAALNQHAQHLVGAGSG